MEPSRERALARDLLRALLHGVNRRTVVRLTVYFRVLRGLAQSVVDHPGRYLVLLAVSALSGLVGSLGVALGVAAAAGWAFLAYERRAMPEADEAPRLRPLVRATWRPAVSARLSARRCLCLAGASSALVAVLVLAQRPGLGFLTGAAGLAAVAWLRVPPARRERWWDERSLVDLLVDAGVLKAPARGQRLHLSRRGKPAHDDTGTHVSLELPGAVPWNVAAGKRAELAAGLGVDPALVAVTHTAGTPGGALTLSVLKPRPPLELGGLSPLCSTTEPGDPMLPTRMGSDLETGEPILLGNDEENFLAAGIPGSGKTELVRMKLRPYLMNPRAELYVLDGKGSRKDYAGVRTVARARGGAFVWGTDEDAPEQLEQMLGRVLALVRHRNEVDEDGTADWPPVLVLLEELQDVRDGAETRTIVNDAGEEETVKGPERIDRALRRIVRMGRAVRVQVGIVTQRTTVDDVPSSYRNLLSQRIAVGTVPNRSDYALVLGVSKVDVPLPAVKRGQGVVRVDGEVRAIVPDRFPLPEWKAVLAAAAQLGRPVELEKRTAGLSDHTAAAPSEPIDPLVCAVLPLLAAGPLPAATLLVKLPADIAPADARSLGVQLRAADPAGRWVERARFGGRSYRWGTAGTSAGTPAGTAGATTGSDTHDPSTTVAEGQHDAEEAVP